MLDIRICGEENFVAIIKIIAGQELINLRYPPELRGWGWDWNEALKYVLDNYDTGGYTGNWNSSDGRVAVLHQKELVLNAKDTENILSAVNATRKLSYLKQLNNIKSGSIGIKEALTRANSNNIAGDTIKQRVEIKAEFPNVQDAREIETALLELANSAYQHAYRYR